MRFSVKVKNNASFPIVYLIDNLTNTKAEIYSFGALLNAFTIHQNQQSINIIDGFSSPDDARANITNGFKSTRLSPYTCRLNKGQYVFDGKEYQIEKFFLGEHTIHGLTYDAPFTILETNADDSFASVTLQYIYNNDDKGYPFSYNNQLIWKLLPNNKLTITSTVQHTNPTAIPYGEGWHPYFTLQQSINDNYLQFDSNTMLEFDSTLIPTKKLVEDNRFINPSLINDTFLDNCFLLHNPQPNTPPKCTLSNHQIEILIQPDPSYPYLQVYTPPSRTSIAIENLSCAPDAFNNQMGLLHLQPNQTYTFQTSYTATWK